MDNLKNDRKYLLNVGDGPEGLAIYTSEHEDAVNWLDGAVYMEFSDINTRFKGTLTLRAIREGIQKAFGEYVFTEEDE